MREDYGNPSSAHAGGVAATRRVRAARDQLLAALGDEDGACGDVYWTSGGTEADALGVLGPARAHARRGRHVVCSAIEHPAVLESIALLERDGWSVTRVPVTRAGVVDVERVVDCLSDDTAVLALMLVNNELGTVQPVAQVAAAARARLPTVHVHCDAVQALAKVALDVTTLGADSVALSSHKLHGPKGVGALWLRHRARITPLWAGGGQQRGVRSGTENVPGIAGFGAAVRLAMDGAAARHARWAELEATLHRALAAAGVSAGVNCAGAPRAPHIVSLNLAGVPGEPLLHALEARGVLVSAGSACASSHKGPSHVLKAIGVAASTATIRVSFGRDTEVEDVTRAADMIADAIATL